MRSEGGGWAAGVESERGSRAQIYGRTGGNRGEKGGIAVATKRGVGPVPRGTSTDPDPTVEDCGGKGWGRSPPRLGGRRRVGKGRGPGRGRREGRRGRRRRRRATVPLVSTDPPSGRWGRGKRRKDRFVPPRPCFGPSPSHVRPLLPPPTSIPDRPAEWGLFRAAGGQEEEPLRGLVCPLAPSAPVSPVRVKLCVLFN